MPPKLLFAVSCVRLLKTPNASKPLKITFHVISFLHGNKISPSPHAFSRSLSRRIEFDRQDGKGKNLDGLLCTINMKILYYLNH